MTVDITAQPCFNRRVRTGVRPSMTLCTTINSHFGNRSPFAGPGIMAKFQRRPLNVVQPPVSPGPCKRIFVVYMSEISRKFKGVWIPKHLWLSKEVTWMEKCLVAEIDSLSDDDLPCDASKEYLSKLFDVSPARIVNMVSALRTKGVLAGRFGALQVQKKFTESVKIVHGIREEMFTESVKIETPAYNTREISKDKINTKGRSIAQNFILKWDGFYFEAFGVKSGVWPSTEKLERLVSSMLASGLTEDHLFEIAKKAWAVKGSKDHWRCTRQSEDLKTFLENFVLIRSELTVIPKTRAAEQHQKQEDIKPKLL